MVQFHFHFPASTEFWPTHHKSPHSFFLNSFLFFLFLSVCNRVVAHDGSVEFHQLGLDCSMVFTEVTCMLQYGVQVLLVFLATFSLLLHLLLLLKLFSDPIQNEKNNMLILQVLNSIPFLTKSMVLGRSSRVDAYAVKKKKVNYFLLILRK